MCSSCLFFFFLPIPRSVRLDQLPPVCGSSSTYAVCRVRPTQFVGFDPRSLSGSTYVVCRVRPTQFVGFETLYNNIHSQLKRQQLKHQGLLRQVSRPKSALWFLWTLSITFTYLPPGQHSAVDLHCDSRSFNTTLLIFVVTAVPSTQRC